MPGVSTVGDLRDRGARLRHAIDDRRANRIPRPALQRQQGIAQRHERQVVPEDARILFGALSLCFGPIMLVRDPRKRILARGHIR